MTTHPSSRDAILERLRAARRPFADAPPRPADYLDVTVQDDTGADALLARFSREVRALFGEVHLCHGDSEARSCALAVLDAHCTPPAGIPRRVLAWDFAHIPIAGLEAAVREAGIEVVGVGGDEPAILRGDGRAAALAIAETAQVGITGADAALATTGSLVVTTAPGRGRLPTVLAPVHLAVITRAQLLPRLETWIAGERDGGLGAFGAASANFCLITGPSRTGDIEMELILGVHGPGKVIVIVKDDAIIKDEAIVKDDAVSDAAADQAAADQAGAGDDAPPAARP